MKESALGIFRGVIVLILFFLSGATALIYEVLWSKQLGLMLGSTIQAQTVVLAAYMGGLALGNRLFGRRADLLEQPLKAYGFVEAAIGLYAFFFHAFHALADRVFVAGGTPLLPYPTALLALKALLGGGLVLIPTVLMGGTLPLLAAWLRQRDAASRRLSARFYAINSLGAVAGAWLGGFILIRELGVLASTQLAALVNVAIGFTALALARRETAVPSPEPIVDAPASGGGAGEPFRWGNAATLVAFTGAVSMGLEVLASRSLALVFGPSLQAFATVLMAFILGIGLCSVLISSRRAAAWHRAGTAPALMLAAAALIVGYVVFIEGWVIAYSQIRIGLAANPTGYLLHQVLVAVIAILVLGLPAGLLGTVLPLCLQTATGSGAGLGREVGRLLTWNTLGAVAGVLLTGFVLMPWLGLRGGFLALAALLGCAVLASSTAGWGRRRMAAACSLCVIALVAVSGGERWRHALGSGIFRVRNAPLTRERLKQRRQDIRYLFYEDAADASVSVETWNGKESSNEIVLRINGKPDASTQGDLSTQYLLAHLPLLARPEAKEVFVLGFGSGITAGAVLGHPVERLTIAENCGPVLRAAGLFGPWNRNVLKSPKTRVFGEDARTLLKLDPTRYDVIISEPSNPWVSGIGGVFSREFYELAASRLGPGGVMAQWFHVYEMHDGIVDLVLRTFGSVFPFVEVWEAADTDIILLGSMKPWPSTAAHYATCFTRPAVRADLAAIGLVIPESLFARQVASQSTAYAIAGDGAIQSDGFPVLEYEAPRAFYLGANATRLFQFDERSRQARLAPAAKQAAAGLLTRDRLREVFRQFPTENPSIRRLLEARPASRAAADPGESSTLFVGAKPDAEVSVAPAPASVERQRFAAAIGLLDGNEQSRAAAVQELRSLVQAASMSSTNHAVLDWSPADAAAVGARLALVQGKAGEVADWIKLGRQVARDPQEFDYLERLARQGAAAHETLRGRPE